MMKCEQYNVMFYGDLAPGNTREQVKNSLAMRFHIGPRQLDRLFRRTPFLLKQEINYTTALKFQILFEWSGLLCRIEPATRTSETAMRTLPEYYNVVFSGELCEGYTIDDVKCNLMVFLHLTNKRMNELFAGHPVTLMQDVASYPALKMQISFELAGAICRLEPVQHDPSRALAPNTFPEAQTPPVAVEQMLCPKCGFQQPQSRKCRHCGIYVENYVKKRPVCKALRLKRLAQQTDAAMKQELLYWGIGLSVFGALHVIGLGVWTMIFVGLGILNLLFRRHPGLLVGRGMFLVNGLTLFGAGGWNLLAMLSNSASLHEDMGIQFEIGHVESSMMIGGILLLRVLQISFGIYGLGRFRQYVSTPKSLSKK